MPWRPYLPECPTNTKDYNSQNFPCQQHTWLPAVPWETTKAMATLPGAPVWFHSLLALQQGVSQLRDATVRLSLALEDEFIFG